MPLDPLNVSPLHLELGCGGAKRRQDAVGVDVLDLPGVDVVADALEVLRELPAGSVDSIYSEHFLEHLTDPHALLRESTRVLKPGARFTAVIPHYSNPIFYSDPTHRTFFGLYTFGYWIRETPFRRQTPHYEQPLPLRLETVRFGFKAGRPFPVRHALVMLLGSWVNLSRWTQEFYEFHLCWILPCWEVRFDLMRIPD